MSDDLDVVDGGTETQVTKQHVEERVQDWKNRLSDLFRDVGGWARDNGWQVDDRGKVSMHEELMQKFNLPPTSQPTLRLDGECGYALFKPKGLWVIGANGRVDLYTSKGTFIIVDLAERGEPPRWTIFRTSSKREGEPFSPEILANLI
ncbi:hypothetical protein [Rhodopseudomonas palustris]|uniref:hypothetical protein n=1 Tax=Rhodopseudomonas palustris TaxID=1076 RepID=UPI0010588551|nr:hypothetical protein [Rhodopseudomonas palustris]QLH73016.1 hypothetical protein HZF03_20295 [Rhodopseudomonas palustris]